MVDSTLPDQADLAVVTVCFGRQDHHHPIRQAPW